MSVPYMGDYDATETVNIPFNTFTSNDPSASVTVTNLVAGDIEIHKDGSTTKRSSDSGVTVSIDFDSITGNHMVHIDLSDDTDSGYYALGSRFQVRLEGITVDGATLNVFIGTFSMGCMLRPTVAGRELDVSAGGEAGVDWANVGSPTTTVGLSNTTIGTATVATTATNLTNAPTNGDLTATMKSSVQGEVDTAIATAKLDHLCQNAESSDVANGTIIAKLACSGATATWSTFANTTDSLQAIRDVAPHGSTMVGTNNAALASGVDVTSIHGSALTESTSGYLAAAFVKLFDVASPLLVASDAMRGTNSANTTVPDAAGTASSLHTTTNNAIAALNNFDPANDTVASVTAVGTVTTCTTTTTNSDMITAQNVRDAMKLAPTAGSPATGSVDKHLDDVESDTDELQTDDIPTRLTSIDGYVDCLPVTLYNFNPSSDTVGTVTTVGTLTGHTAQTGNSYPIVSHVTYGNSAIETLVDEIETMLKSATYGLSAIETLVDDLETRVPANYIDRIYQLLQNKLTFVNATGGATLSNVGDSATLATWGVTDNDTTTVRTEASWV